MAIPDTPVDQWRTALQQAWTAAELADSEAKLELWDSAGTQARIAQAWAAVADAATRA
ncbi:MAG: hypothetical protein JWN29_629 [Acidimicrobiales bacterium]|jgi:hypothetical protein|nr:hypothetical protein [Acidimicrobiales bacterium]